MSMRVKTIIFNVEHLPSGRKAMHAVAHSTDEAKQMALEELGLPAEESSNLKARLSNNQFYDVQHQPIGKPVGQVVGKIEARDGRAARRKAAGRLHLPKTEVKNFVVVRRHWE